VVKTLVEADFEDWAPISRPQVYYSLRKLAEHGYVVPTEDGEPRLGPDRVVYRPTAEARRAMERALARPEWATRRPPDPFTTWVALAAHADPESIGRQVRRRADFLETEIERERRTLAGFGGSGEPGADVARILVTLVIRRFETELRALDELGRAILSSHAAAHPRESADSIP
jgi:DNA-binding PadR family transcriptional regulator